MAELLLLPLFTCVGAVVRLLAAYLSPSSWVSVRELDKEQWEPQWFAVEVMKRVIVSAEVLSSPSF